MKSKKPLSIAEMIDRDCGLPHDVAVAVQKKKKTAYALGRKKVVLDLGEWLKFRIEEMQRNISMWEVLLSKKEGSDVLRSHWTNGIVRETSAMNFANSILKRYCYEK